MQRLQYIDKLKGFAILSVVIGHLVCFCMHYSSWNDASNNPYMAIVYSYHMPLFMFLSGFVITEFPSMKKLSHKLLRFLLPFMVVGAIYSVVNGNMPWDFLTNEFKFGYWYLWVLSIYYIFLFFAKSLLRNWGGIVTFAIGVWVCLKILMLIVPSDIINLLSLDHIEAMWIYFICGILLNHCGKIKQISRSNNFMTICWLISIALALLFYNMHITHFIQTLYLLIVLSLFSLFRLFENNKTVLDKGLAYIGRHSLDVYVFHYFFLKIVNLSFLRIWVDKTENFLFEGLLIIPLSIVIALLSIGIGCLIRQSNLLRIVVYGDLTIKKK